MVTNALILMLSHAVHVLWLLFPVTVVEPSWWGEVDAAFSTVFEYAGSLGVWFPAPVVATILAGVFSSIVAGLGIRLVRIIASFFTLGGGAAG